jgi:hypothetical protein
LESRKVPGLFFHRRSGRRHRAARRIQLPVGMGVRILRRAGSMRQLVICDL